MSSGWQGGPQQGGWGPVGPQGPQQGPPPGYQQGPPPGYQQGPPPGYQQGWGGGQQPPAKRNGAVLWLAAGLAVVLLVAGGIFFSGVLRGGQADSGEGEIMLVAADSVGQDAFSTTPFATPPDQNLAKPVSAQASAPATGPATAASGGKPGLYGGSLNMAVCDPAAIVSFLGSTPDKAAAWAGVLAADPAVTLPDGGALTAATIPAYVATLTPVVLTQDTRVTNHGFKNGRATTLQSVLQKGTAVLVDTHGTPRVKCYCGNPLLAPVPTRTTPTYVYEVPPTTQVPPAHQCQSEDPATCAWPDLTPTVVTPTQQPLSVIVMVDPATGGLVDRPVGTTGGSDTISTQQPPAQGTTPTSGATTPPTGGTSPPSSATAPPTSTTTSSPTTQPSAEPARAVAPDGSFSMPVSPGWTAKPGTNFGLPAITVSKGGESFDVWREGNLGRYDSEVIGAHLDNPTCAFEEGTASYGSWNGPNTNIVCAGVVTETISQLSDGSGATFVVHSKGSSNALGEAAVNSLYFLTVP